MSNPQNIPTNREETPMSFVRVLFEDDTKLDYVTRLENGNLFTFIPNEGGESVSEERTQAIRTFEAHDEQPPA